MLDSIRNNFSQFLHNKFKAITSKLSINSTDDIKTNSEIVNEILKKSKDQNMQIIQENTKQISKQISELKEELLEKSTLQYENFRLENTKQNSELKKELIEKSMKEQTQSLKKYLLVQISKQNIELKEEIIEKSTLQYENFMVENTKQNSELKKELLEKSIKNHENFRLENTKQNIELKEELLEKSTLQYENFMGENTKQNIEFMKQNKIEKLEYIKQNYQQNLAYITQNKQKISEYIDKIIKRYDEKINKFIDQVSEIEKQNKKQYEELGTQNKKQISETVAKNRKQNVEHQEDFFVKFNKYLIKEMTKHKEQISKHAMQENTKLQEQTLEKIDQKILTIMKQISDKSSIHIKENAKLINVIFEQANQGILQKKVDKLVMYQPLLALRENLITIKINMTILEKLDSSKLRVVKNLYLEYKRLYPKIPFLDVTRGMIITKVLFPSFFKEILKNITHLKNQFEDESYTEMTKALHAHTLFFNNFNHKSINENQIILESNIAILDEMLAKIMD